MAYIAADRVRETTVSTGTGALSLAGVPDASYRTFATVMADGDIAHVLIRMGADWERSLVTFDATAGTLKNRTVLENSAGDTSAIDFGVGTKDIFMDLAAKRAQDLFDSTGGLNRVRFDSAQSLTAAQKAKVSANIGQAGLAKTANYTAGADDNGQLITLGGSGATLSLTAAATLGAGWRCRVRNINSGSGLWTIDPDSSETIDGKTTLTVGLGECIDIFCDGTGFVTTASRAHSVELKRVAASNAATVDFDFASGFPTDFEEFIVEWYGAQPRTDGKYLLVCCKTGAGLSVQNGSGAYTYAAGYNGLAGDANAGSTTTGGSTNLPMTPNAVGVLQSNTSGELGRGSLKFSRPNTSKVQVFSFESGFIRDADGASINYRGSGNLVGLSAITGLQFAFSGGNMDGSFVLKGMRT